MNQDTEFSHYKERGRLTLSSAETPTVLGIGAFSLDRLVSRGLINPSRALCRPLFPIWKLERFLRATAGEIPQ